MRLIYLLPLSVALVGCGKGSSGSGETNTASSSSPLTAPVDYLGAVAKAHETAVKTIDTTTLQHAIQMFQAEQGRYPKDLDELVTEKVIPRLPDMPRGMKLVYDPAKGTVKVVREP